MGILKQSEDSRPLVYNNKTEAQASSINNVCDGYINEAICNSENLFKNNFDNAFHREINESVISSSPKKMNEVASEELNNNRQMTSQIRGDNCNVGSTSKLLPHCNFNLSLVEQMELRSAAWFQAGLPREITLEILSGQDPGAFLVRQSSSKAGCFVLSLRVPAPVPQVAHYLIMRTLRGYKIKGFPKEFSSLRALITHHSVMKEFLPVALSLPRPQQKTQNFANV